MNSKEENSYDFVPITSKNLSSGLLRLWHWQSDVLTSLSRYHPRINLMTNYGQDIIIFIR